jgi:peptide/nickel transport system substrate-binding protein
VRQVRAIVCALATSLAGAAPARAEVVVRWVTTLAPSGLDPHAFGNQQTSAVHLELYEPLIDVDWRMGVEPSLAVRWSLVSPTAWRFELRPGVAFHGGEPLTAEDVVFSLERARADTSAWSDFLPGITSIEAPDAGTVVVTTRMPDLILPYRLTSIPILSKRWAESHDAIKPAASGALATDAAAWRDAGTGPFVPERFEPGARLVLTRHPGWWGTSLYPDAVDRIEQVVAPSREAAADLVLRGEADFFWTQQAPPGLLDRLEAAPGVRVTRAETANIQYFGFDLASPELRTSTVKGRNPFKDRRVREAVYRAVDFEGIKAALGGLAAPAGMIVGRTAAGWSEELDRPLPHDPEGARQLLAEAGYPDGFGVALDCPASREAACRFYPEMLARVGIRADLRVRPSGELDQIMQAHRTDFVNWGWIEPLDASMIFRSLYHSGSPYALPGVAGPELDALIDELEAEPTTYGRDVLMERLWKRVLGDILYVPLYRTVNAWAMRAPLALPMGANLYPQFRFARGE